MHVSGHYTHLLCIAFSVQGLLYTKIIELDIIRNKRNNIRHKKAFSTRRIDSTCTFKFNVLHLSNTLNIVSLKKIRN